MDTAPLVMATLRCRENSSLVTYASGWDRWRKWCRNMGRPVWPPNQADLGLAMLAAVQEGVSESVVINLYSAVTTFSAVLGNVRLEESSLLQDVKKYVRRHGVRKKKERDPLSYEDLKRIVENTSWTDLVSVRLTVICVVGWHGFLRFSDLAVLRYKDVKFERDHVKLEIRRSKTDPEGRGQSVVVARNDSEADPWTLLKSYMEKMEFEAEKNPFLFPRMQRIGADELVVWDEKPIQYKGLMKELKELVDRLGLELDKVGIHCLRVGGATFYTRMGVSNDVVREKGRWKCESTRVKYARVHTEDLLQTTNIF